MESKYKKKRFRNEPSCPSTAIAFCFMYSVKNAPMLVLSTARASEGSVESVFCCFLLLLEVEGEKEPPRFVKKA